MVGPGRNNWNMALFKAFQFNERARFEFRAETFNTFNHTQFSESQHDGVTNADFGQINEHLQPAHLAARREVPVLIEAEPCARSPASHSHDRQASGRFLFARSLTPASASFRESAQSQ